jgi:hypothetical protein
VPYKFQSDQVPMTCTSGVGLYLRQKGTKGNLSVSARIHLKKDRDSFTVRENQDLGKVKTHEIIQSQPAANSWVKSTTFG